MSKALCVTCSAGDQGLSSAARCRSSGTQICFIVATPQKTTDVNGGIHLKKS